MLESKANRKHAFLRLLQVGAVALAVLILVGAGLARERRG